MVNSRAKGISAEREFIRSLGKMINIPWIRRNLEQYQASGSDLIATPREGTTVSEQQQNTINVLEKLSIEIKRYRLCRDGNIDRWFNQSVRQAAKEKRIPILAYRGDYSSWTVMVPAIAAEYKSEFCFSMRLPLFSYLILYDPNKLFMSR